MIIYYITIFLLFLVSFLELNYSITPRIRVIFSILIYIVLICQVGLRWETGTDWNSYLAHFDSISDLDSTSPFLTGMEYGYNLFIWGIKKISDNYSFFLFVHAIIYYFLIFKSFKKIISYQFVALLMFYTTSMGMMGSNRQLLAAAICLYSLKFVVSKKPIKFSLLILIAISFHTTAFLFAIYYFLNKEIKPIPLFIVLFSAIIIGRTQVVMSLFEGIGNLIGGNASDKTAIYLAGAQDELTQAQVSTIGLIKRIVFILIFYSNRRKITQYLPNYHLILNGYIVGLIFYFLFSSSLLIMVSRGNFYFSIMESLLIAAQLVLIKDKTTINIVFILLLIMSIAFLFQSISPYPDLFDPYKGLFINTDFHREIH